MKSLIQILTLLLCMQLTGVSHAADPPDPAKKEDQIADVRVIIDVSGSMKKNDPDNLRVPALKLLVGLLPEGVKAGVWNFGTKVKPLVKYGVVNKKWKAKANKSANKIYSGDMFTNVESALKLVTKDWDETDSEVKRNIILLTDGMVDVSKKQEKSDASRQRILDEVLPQLQKKGVTVHTISLSENADLELMDALAVGTDGSSEQVNSADQLQRVFLHMFEKSTPRDTVPLEGNQFTIDKMIEEFTLLVFRNNDIKESTVVQPDGKKFTRKTAPKNVAWLEEDGYDLVTISKPAAGVWKIDADIDPDNRVMVVTKLKLHTSVFPNSIFAGEEYDYKLWITAAGKTIKKEAFYNLIEVKMLQTSGGQIQEVWSLEDRNNDNEFVKKLGDTFKDGELELSVIVDGKTFKREKRQTINVYKQIVEVEVKESGTSGSVDAHVIHLKPRVDLIDEKSLQIIASVTAPDGKEEQLTAVKAMIGTEWLVAIKEPQKGQYKAVMEISADTKSGRKVTVNTDFITIGEPVVGDDEEKIADESIEEAVEETDWMKIGMVILAANVVLFGLIGGGWFFMKKRRKNATEPGEDL